MLFTAGNFHFFTPTLFCFHGEDLEENFTETFKFSRAVFMTFSREGSHFHRLNSKKNHGKKKKTGKKKHRPTVAWTNSAQPS